MRRWVPVGARQGRCEGLSGARGRLALFLRARCPSRARLVGAVSVSGSVRHLVGRRGLVVDFVTGCAARCLCSLARCRACGLLLVARAGCRARDLVRVVSRCLTWCGVVCVEGLVASGNCSRLGVMQGGR